MELTQELAGSRALKRLYRIQECHGDETQADGTFLE